MQGWFTGYSFGYDDAEVNDLSGEGGACCTKTSILNSGRIRNAILVRLSSPHILDISYL